MDAGLSTRMVKALQDLLPTAAAIAPPSNFDPTTAIDLSDAQNSCIRDEVQEFFKTIVEEKLTEKTFSLPTKLGGDTAVRAALASFFNSYFHPVHTVCPDHVVVTAGASDALESLIHAICDDGDSVIIPGPYWYGFEPILKGRANVNTIVAHPPSYKNHSTYLLPALQTAYEFSNSRSRIKAVILCNPQNPFSRSYPKRVIIECMEFCQERGLHFVCDELYAHASIRTAPADAPRFVSALSLAEPLQPEGAVKVDPSRVHVLWSPSKLFGSSGLRVGCMISQSNPQLRMAVSAITYAHSNNIGTLYLTSLLNWSKLPTLIALNSERLTESYRLLAEAFEKWNIEFIPPTEGLFLFAKLAKDVKTVEEETSFFSRLTGHGIRVSPGRLYNGLHTELGWARMKFSVPADVMAAALAKLWAFLAKEAS
ncbi:PLP-dependent transferase [Zopfia rhizophila CBS 207.26]|uniref:PLP-dependent transferase n=1 Tax=Zopfia rhizophila CBS 207.26 TaxID=1314779 RepID=A0A6A6E9W5_9PEZI|nr:PLP-dependent transferase [Zopfia rhizophila CBS 207.26]